MKRNLFKSMAAAVLAICLGLGMAVTDAAAQGGYIDLIQQGENGKYNKHGWNHYGPGYFTLDRDTGVLTSHGGMGLFWYSAEQFGDFVLELDFMVDDYSTNSGIFVRIPNMPTSNDYIYECFEIQIYDAALDKNREHVMHEGAQAPPASEAILHATGAVYDAKGPDKMASKGPNEWNHYKITLQGLKYTIELNGEKVNEWEVRPAGKVKTHWPKGYIGLQNHDDTSSVHFRNIRIKPL